MTDSKPFKEEDLVQRISGEGGFGTVKFVREEIQSHSSTTRAAKYLINVLWDNGTLSYLAPEALQKCEQRK